MLENEYPLGGFFELTVESTNIIAWIEEMTWHHGRDEIPRTVDDELKMRRDGVPQDWFWISLIFLPLTNQIYSNFLLPPIKLHHVHLIP